MDVYPIRLHCDWPYLSLTHFLQLPLLPLPLLTRPLLLPVTLLYMLKLTLS